jgi:hypothetical protein
MAYSHILERKIRCYSFFAKTCEKKDCFGEDITCISYQPVHPSAFENNPELLKSGLSSSGLLEDIPAN